MTNNFREQFEAGIVSIARGKLVDQIYHRIYYSIKSCWDLATPHTTEILISGIALAFHQETMRDHFDKVLFERWCQYMEADTKPSSTLMDVWQTQQISRNSNHGATFESAMNSCFQLFDNDSTASLFDGVFTAMHEIKRYQTAADCASYLSFFDFCDLADSLTMAPAGKMFERACKVYMQNNRLEVMARKIDAAVCQVANRYMPELLWRALRAGVCDSLIGYLDSDEELYSQCCELLATDVVAAECFYFSWKNTVCTPDLFTENFRSNTARIFCGENHDNSGVAELMTHAFYMLHIFADDNNWSSLTVEVDLFWNDSNENGFLQFCELADVLQQ